jgi:hypothetical protein
MSKLWIAAALLSAPQIGAAQEPVPCLTSAEATDLVIFVAPTLIEGVAGNCAASLPRSASLRTGAGALAQKLRGDGDRWSAVRGSLEKIGGEKMPAGLSEETTRKVFEEAMTAAMLAEVDAVDCPSIDRMLGALAPLPAANLGTLFATILELGTKDDDSDAPFRICPAGG